MPSNKAAWLVGSKVSPLEVKEAPYPTAGPKDLIVKVGAVAVNPLEYRTQDFDMFKFKYPTIQGADMAGTIVETGSDITKYKVGQHVMAHMHGIFTGDHASSAFQNFTRVSEREAVLIPEDLPFEKATVLPLGCETAAAGLFVPDQLGLSTARLGGTGSEPPAPGSTILIWGGSSSVGCCAVQIARAAGYEVVTTASARNHELCKSVGANKVFDYNHASIEDEVVAAFKGKNMVGALDCIGDSETTIPACARILARTGGRRKILSVMTPTETKFEGGVEARRVMIPEYIPIDTYDVVHAWMPKAVANGTLKPKPDPRVIGDGLEFIQQGMDILRKGVSATKIVIRL